MVTVRKGSKNEKWKNDAGKNVVGVWPSFYAPRGS